MALHGVRVVPGRSASHSCFSSHVPGQDRSSFVQRDVICYFLLLFTPWTCLTDSICIVSVLSKLGCDALLNVLFVWASGCLTTIISCISAMARDQTCEEALIFKTVKH